MKCVGELEHNVCEWTNAIYVRCNVACWQSKKLFIIFLFSENFSIATKNSISIQYFYISQSFILCYCFRLLFSLFVMVCQVRYTPQIPTFIIHWKFITSPEKSFRIYSDIFLLAGFCSRFVWSFSGERFLTKKNKFHYQSTAIVSSIIIYIYLFPRFSGEFHFMYLEIGT